MYTHSFWSDMCMHASTMHINVHAHFYMMQQLLNSAEFESEEENKSSSGGSNVYSQQFSNAIGTWPKAHSLGPKANQTPSGGARNKGAQRLHILVTKMDTTTEMDTTTKWTSQLRWTP